MFLIYRNRSANIGIEMKLKKHLSKMIKRYAPFFAGSLDAPFSGRITSTFEETQFFEQKQSFF
jgi:hypothetical protein